MVAAIIRIGLFLISWFSVFLIPKNDFKKFTPVALFATVLLLIETILSVPFKWWTVKGGPLKKAVNDFSFIFGPFFVGTIWIFRFTYGKPLIYMITNVLMDAFLAYPVSWVMQKLNVFKLVKFKPKHIFFTAIIYALVIYGFQMVISHSRFKNKKSSVSH
ncbi:hypothetical protein [Neobacillus cucumis]|uniref:Uncharacterized protein n=1 Tax=Neobacillus cucumis TaxID=1740721 RepID=A0A2N5HVQ0_9BACI|nr:hypothetical protein [Neobacillus cucumis]PLS09589.1 hypothetical protein CVD27_01750 [Neobacillus cucumis]